MSHFPETAWFNSVRVSIAQGDMKTVESLLIKSPDMVIGSLIWVRARGFVEGWRAANAAEERDRIGSSTVSG